MTRPTAPAGRGTEVLKDPHDAQTRMLGFVPNNVKYMSLRSNFTQKLAALRHAITFGGRRLSAA